jgi:AraC family transcriptional regulator, regulatory protein of adaptative response / methylated-DNA-[protein]-cysteine methyltransferase
MTVIYRTEVESPLGTIVLLAHDRAVVLCDFHDRRDMAGGIERALKRFGAREAESSIAHPLLEQAREELAEYFEGRRQSFDLPLDPPEQPFARQCWDALLAIPYGETRSYARQARAIGNPAAVRAVARANGENFLSLLIPCHRVIASTGALTGYGGGLTRKAWLLDHERQHATNLPSEQRTLFDLAPRQSVQ